MRIRYSFSAVSGMIIFPCALVYSFLPSIVFCVAFVFSFVVSRFCAFAIIAAVGQLICCLFCIICLFCRSTSCCCRACTRSGCLGFIIRNCLLMLSGSLLSLSCLLLFSVLILFVLPFRAGSLALMPAVFAVFALFGFVVLLAFVAISAVLSVGSLLWHPCQNDQLISRQA